MVPGTSSGSNSSHKSCGACHVLRSGLQQSTLPLYHFVVKCDAAEMIFRAEVLQNLQESFPCLFQGENNHFEYFYFDNKIGVNLQHNKEIYYWQHTRCSPVPLFRPNSIFQLRPSEMANSPDLQTHKKHSQDGYRGLFCSPANLCTQFSIKEK